MCACVGLFVYVCACARVCAHVFVCYGRVVDILSAELKGLGSKAIVSYVCRAFYLSSQIIIYAKSMAAARLWVYVSLYIINVFYIFCTLHLDAFVAHLKYNRNAPVREIIQTYFIQII